MIITRSPVRISFGGGGTDMEPFYSKYEGAVVSTTINKYFFTIFKPREDNTIQMISSDLQSTLTVDDFYNLKFGEGFDIPAAVIKHFRIHHGFDLFMASEIPAGSGLGSSGAVTVNMAHMCSKLKNEAMTNYQIAEDAYFIQREVLNLPIGKQDEFAAAFGGLNLIEFKKKNVILTPLQLDNKFKEKMENNLMLFFTGKTRSAATILKNQDESAKTEDKETIKAMLAVKENAYQIKNAIMEGNLEGFAHLLHEAWESKKKMSSGISNEFIDGIYDLARKHGAIGGKLTGAGGGGFFLFYCEQEKQESLRNVLEQRGLKFLDFHFENKGVTTLMP